MTPLDTTLQQFLWKDRCEPFYATHPTTIRWAPVDKEKALRRLRNGYRYFAPVPRITLGNKRQDCAPSFNVLWCDIDLSANLSTESILDALANKLEATKIDLFPSAIVYTGNRGVHLYWKLSEDLPGEQIEHSNQRLLRTLGGDPKVYDLPRFLRHPGTPHEKTGQPAELISLDESLIWSIADLERLPDHQPQKQARTAPPAQAAEVEWLTAAQALVGWAEHEIDVDSFPIIFQDYMAQLPTAPWSRYGYTSRSEIEQAIVYRLVGKAHGASDHQILELADECFAKHREQPSDNYITTTIRSARRHHYERGWITSPLGGYPRKRQAEYRKVMPEDREALLTLVQGQPLAQWIREIQKHSFTRATAYRIKDRLLSEGGIRIEDGRVHPTR